MLEPLVCLFHECARARAVKSCTTPSSRLCSKESERVQTQLEIADHGSVSVFGGRSTFAGWDLGLAFDAV